MNNPANDKSRLSILLVAYNHENYIRESLDSIFRQSFVGEIELVVADDASTDNTLAIIREYEGRDARFHFKYLESTDNMGITKNYQRGFAACSGEYVAIMECDDYWVSPLKLQRQVDFLDGHQECTLCAVNCFVLDESKSHMYPRTLAGSGYRHISAQDLIADNIVSNFSTCMYRKAALDALPDRLFEMYSDDWIVNICAARKSMIGYLEEPMSVYRLHAQGTWTQLTQVEKLKAQLELLSPYDALTEGVFHSEFETLRNRLEMAISSAKSSQAKVQQVKARRDAISSVTDWLPPIVVIVAKYLIPPKLKFFLVRKFLRSQK